MRMTCLSRPKPNFRRIATSAGSRCRFTVALILWRLLMEGALIFSGFRLVRGFRIQNPLTPGGVCAAILLLNYYAISALVDGDISILAIAFFMIGMAAVRDGESELAGIMFAFSTIKCSVTFFPVLFPIVRGRSWPGQRWFSRFSF